MALLIECPQCKTRNSPKTDKCKCGLGLKKVGSKTYWVEFYDETGRRRRERVGPSKMAAEQRLRDILKARTEERHIQKDLAARVTLGELCKWYENLPEVKAKASYVRDLCSIKNLLRLLGDTTKVKELTSGRVESYRQHRLEEPATRKTDEKRQPSPAKEKDKKTAPSTVNKEVICLKTILNRAVRHEKIDRNPIRDLKKLSENNVRMRVLSNEEFEKLVEACPEYLKPVVITAFYSGMRKSEIIFLTWDEVDLLKGFVRLRADRTKTKEARAIPLHRRVKAVLSTIPRGLHTDRVFLKDGIPFQDFKKSYRSACKKCGLADFTFHDLRHCAINNLRLAGNDYFKVMAVSGHKTMAVFKRYNLVTEEELQTLQWERKEPGGAIDTYMDTKQKKVTGSNL